MSAKRLVPPLPEPERRQSLEQFLRVLDEHPNLAHFRTIATTGPERQLALFAALERALLVGSPSASPPTPSDDADLLLCDILDCIDRHPDLNCLGSAYGPLRHLANLQAFGVWNGKGPTSAPSSRELFTTAISRLTSDAPTTLPSSPAITSPPSQVLSPGGDLITPPPSSEPTSSIDIPSPEVASAPELTPSTAPAPAAQDSADSLPLSHHPASTPGDQFPHAQLQPSPSVSPSLCPSVSPSPCLPLSPSDLPPRPLRRGQPPKLDDFAKGRLLGLMSHGLSFRQAAAQLGVHHTAILRLMKRDEQFAQQVSEARLDAISQPLLTVVQASRTSWRAAAWLAKFLEDRRVRSYETTPEEHELDRLRNS